MSIRLSRKLCEVRDLADRIARSLKHPVVSSTHWLLALIEHEDNLVSPLLRDLGVSSAWVRDQLVGVPALPGSDTEVVMLLARRIAEALGCAEVGPEHVLLALANEEVEGVTATQAQKILKLNPVADLVKLRLRVVQKIASDVRVLVR